jgi:hypothetical protein
MCTVSWLCQDDRYELFCNRDEQKTRPVSRGPEVTQSGQVRFIAPLDCAGGSWIAVNQHGVSFCLLNGSGLSSNKPGSPIRSRGHIVMECATANCVAEACDRIMKVSLVDFAPFRLVLLERGHSPTVVAWNGSSTSIAPWNGVLLASSSVDDAGAQRAREREFHRLTRSSFGSSAEAHLAFHRSHGERASAYTPCMHRPDAETVSFTRVQVTPLEVLAHYSPGPPCRHNAADVLRLSIAS